MYLFNLFTAKWFLADKNRNKKMLNATICNPLAHIYDIYYLYYLYDVSTQN